MSCQILLSRSSPNHVPAKGDHSISETFLIFIRADEVPELTTAYIQKLHAGKGH
ncbi:hypothetical protein HX037_00010 [Ignatzschineria indica]|uniref:hypothetical protein n=1 Tax=Ignatzschineria indica TaxID=472583 RepID=UPI002575CA53|nr:hypothetical protein [Ignatzschineria indica]MDM1544275.1 hypothetical protein [Ignatzschineria indica]